MTICLSCQKEFVSTTGKPQKLCLVCRKDRLARTWKKQMRIYGMAILAGLAMLVYVYVQFKGHQFQGLQGVPVSLLGMMVLGGLGVMGGLFGFALAIFFHLWHRKPSR